MRNIGGGFPHTSISPSITASLVDIFITYPGARVLGQSLVTAATSSYYTLPISYIGNFTTASQVVLDGYINNNNFTVGSFQVTSLEVQQIN
ncbi:hypothetical protein [Pedobacter sp. V48]|uniref:hypothetical protein n=1 Tax=Pedobacter sp. V48 TaxID=509635 RepID=UPI001267E8B4|nr:hypothetical protein [Pedobacter sp. V48]